MRDPHLKAIEYKIARIRTMRRIGKMLLITAVIVAGIITISNLDTTMAEQQKSMPIIADLSEETEKDNQVVAESAKVAVTEEKEPNTTYGTYTITHYCACTRCCGEYADGITATGTKATADRTIAVDPKVIPLGSEVLIDGQVYIAEDVGGAIKGNRIDIYCDSHQEALNRGKIKREVQWKYD